MFERFLKKTIILFVFILLFSNIASAIEARRYVMPNGMVVLHAEKHNLPIVHIVLLIKVSPMDEPEEKAGLANLVAELLTEGTKSMTAEEIAESLSFIGAELSTDQTRDFATVSLAVVKKHLNKAMKIFSDIIQNPAFAPEEIKRMKLIIKDSLKQSEEDPYFVAQKAFIKAIYGEHPYGRLIRGSPETIDNISREDIIRFYTTYYRPNNSIMAVVGDIDKAELKALYRQYLSKWQPADIPEPVEYKIPSIDKGKVITINMDTTQANIVMGHLGIKRSNPDYYAISVMNYILGGGGFASRLMAKIRDEMGLAYDVHSFFTTNKYTGRFQIGLQTKNPSAQTAINVILKELKRIKNEPVSEQELKDAKSYLTGSFPRRIDTMAKIAGFLVRVEFFGLGLDYDKQYTKLINSVTREDVLRVARKYLHEDRLILVVVGNLKQTGPIKIENN